MAQLVGDVAGLAHDFSATAGEAGEQYDKFIAAQAGHRVFLADAAFQAGGDHLQHGIAEGVAERIVDVLEVVEVEKQQRTAQVVALEQGNLLAQAVHQQGAIGQVGQGVVVGQVLDLCLGLLEVADVAGDQQQAVLLIDADRLHRYLHGEQVASAVAHQHFLVTHKTVAVDGLQQGLPLAGFGPDIDFQGGVAQHLIGAVAGQTGEAFVDFQVAGAVALGDGDGVGGGVEGFGEFLFAELARTLGKFPCGLVAEGRGHAVFVAHFDHSGGYHAGQDLTILAPKLGAGVIQALLMGGGGQQLAAHATVEPDVQLLGGFAYYFVCWPTEHLGKAGADLQEDSVAQAGQAHRLDTGLEQSDEFLFGGGQGLFTQGAGGDVMQHAGHAQGLAVAVAIELGGALQVTGAAIGMAGVVGDAEVVTPAVAQLAEDDQRLALFVLRNELEETANRPVIGLLCEPVEFAGAGRGVDLIAAQLPVPETQFGAFQGQAETLLAVLQGLFLAPLAGDVAHGQDQAGIAVDLALGAIQQVDAGAAVAVVQFDFQAVQAAIAGQRIEHALALGRGGPDV